MTKGTIVQFVQKRHIERYGLTGVVTNVQTVVSRPYGFRSTLVDVKTDTGIDIQWPISQIRRDTMEAR